MTRRALITGGAGFVGTNLADRLVRQGHEVVVLDDLSRPGVRRNLRWLRETHRDALRFVEGDVREPALVRDAVAGVDEVFHFAAQVAVTTSVTDPMHDFAVNLSGTLNLLEQVRRLETPPTLLFTSTNKVYGSLADIELTRRSGRYEPVSDAWRAHGVGEGRGLSFASPYGCSKGAADQYVLDYGYTYGLPTTVFRMSCIYGPHQQGNEDQGWVAHFVREAMEGRPITLYGDGRQVRDVLFVDDLLDAMQCAVDGIDSLAGRAFNIGGGAANTVSLLELLDMIADLTGAEPEVELGDWRVGDQRWYVSDTRSFQQATGWQPTVSPQDGVTRLHAWLDRNTRRLHAVDVS